MRKYKQEFNIILGTETFSWCRELYMGISLAIEATLKILEVV